MILIISECNCNVEGSNGTTCDNNGICNCKANIMNDKCDECNVGFFPFPACYTGKLYHMLTWTRARTLKIDFSSFPGDRNELGMSE